MTRTFTGWHMTAILVAFFSVVIGVNIIMARAAIGTFGGKVVENSYVASQKFNGWLDQAEAQKALGWTISASLSPDRRVVVTGQSKEGPLAGARASALMRHPLGRAPDQTLHLVATETGWISTAPLPDGRWMVHITVEQRPHIFQMIETLQ